MKTAREFSRSLSSGLVEHLLSQMSVSQEELAHRLSLSPAFLSRVRHGERSFTVEHLLRIEDIVHQPIGAILLAIRPAKATHDPRFMELQAMAREGLSNATALERAIRARQPVAVRKN